MQTDHNVVHFTYVTLLQAAAAAAGGADTSAAKLEQLLPGECQTLQVSLSFWQCGAGS